MAKLKGNRGEWSEIYVFLRLLEAGKLYAADAELNKIDSVFLNIINIVRSENIGVLEFRINASENTISVYNTDSNELLLELPTEIFKNEANKLYMEIVKSGTSTFEVEETEEFLNSINVNTLKAASGDKADIRMKTHDINTGIEAVQGFSIKSRLGSPSTLVNAGRTTNFLYEVTGLVNDNVMDEFNNTSSLFKSKFLYLKEEAKCDIKYIGMDNDTFESNLLLIDGDLPEICANMLMQYYSSDKSTVMDILDEMVRLNPLKYNLSKGHPFYHYKFKKFLTESALGMLPATPWTGKADATGGYIIVAEGGEVLCYHLYNRNEFEDYLILNTKFETASKSRHGFGEMYKEDGKYYLKLNLQIRFIR